MCLCACHKLGWSVLHSFARSAVYISSLPFGQTSCDVCMRRWGRYMCWELRIIGRKSDFNNPNSVFNWSHKKNIEYVDEWRRRIIIKKKNAHRNARTTNKGMMRSCDARKHIKKEETHFFVNADVLMTKRRATNKNNNRGNAFAVMKSGLSPISLSLVFFLLYPNPSRRFFLFSFFCCCCCLLRNTDSGL